MLGGSQAAPRAEPQAAPPPPPRAPVRRRDDGAHGDEMDRVGAEAVGGPAGPAPPPPQALIQTVVLSFVLAFCFGGRAWGFLNLVFFESLKNGGDSNTPR